MKTLAEKLASYVRHLLTGIAAIGGFLVSLQIIAPDDAAEVNAAAAKLVDPLVALLVAVAVCAVRFAIARLGKRFPVFAGAAERISTDGENADGGNRGGFGGGLPLFLLAAGSLCMVSTLPSCSGVPLTGSLSYRDPKSGAKGGLVFEPGAPPRASVRVPIYDERGELVGMGDLSGPLSRELSPTK